MEKNWYYSPDRQDKKGPVAESDLKQLLITGQIPSTTLVWREGMADWAPANMVAILQVSAANMPPVPIGLVPLPAGPFSSRTYNRDLMKAARECLRGRWGDAVGAVMIYLGISFVLQILSYIPFVGCLANIGSLLIEGPLTLGLALFFLALARLQQLTMGMVFNGFNRFGNALGAYLLMAIFTFLWMLLLIIPGIIAAYRYSMTFFILADHPELGPLDAIRRSTEMMQGNKWKLFCLGWRFLGWALLCMLTCLIGF